MFNLRRIDRFWLSGGWQNVTSTGDVSVLKIRGIKAVLDLQFVATQKGSTSYKDDQIAQAFVKEELAKAGIEYLAVAFSDDEFNTDLAGTFEAGHKFLFEMEEKYPGKKDGILVKCAAGISRSSSMLIYHLCETRRMSYVEALNYVRDKERNFVEYGASPYWVFADFLKKKFKDSRYV